jgi:clan AA aspartic protease
MIIGVVNTHHEATIGLIVQNASGQGHDIDAVIDTGFTGFLTLPTSVIAALGLTWRGYASAVLGDGSLQQFDVYAATVIWDGQARLVEIDAAETDPLVGMGLLYGHEVRIQAIDGGTVTIEALP